MSNGIMNSINILYTPNINDIKRYNHLANPNTMIVSSYMNNGSYIGFDYYKGLSYELYYVDNQQGIHQLSYNFVQGNGIDIKDNTLNINIDNDTFVSSYYKGKNYITVNNDCLKGASPTNRGILYIDPNLYNNDLYRETIVDDDSVCLNSDNQITLAGGFIHDLSKIEAYYKKCNSMLNKIKELSIKTNTLSDYSNIGDILYYDSRLKKYTLDSQTINNDNGEVYQNVPEMICIIPSNVLDDNNPRFIPIKRDKVLYKFDSSNYLYIKNGMNQIPIYETNNVSDIDQSTNVIGANYGFIALNRNDWKNNLKNPFHKKEYYYTSTNKVTTYKNNNTDLTKYEDSLTNNLTWCIDVSKIDYNNNYKISPGSIYSNIIKNPTEKLQQLTIYFIIEVKFDGFSKYYCCNLKYDGITERFINTNDLHSYCVKNTITNNFNLLKENSLENYEKYYLEDLYTYLKSLNINIKPNIKYVELEDFDEEYTNEETTYNDETYVITDKNIELTDIKLEINDVDITNYQNNVYKFNVLSSVNGQANVVISNGTINKDNFIVESNKESETITITNNTNNIINCTISITLTPFEKNRYKSATINSTKFINKA